MFVVTEVIPDERTKTMSQSEWDALFFDLVYSDVNVTEEQSMEDYAFNYELADNGLMS